MGEEEKNESKELKWTHPYVMDPGAFDEKMSRAFAIDPEKLKAMLREFVSYHGFNDHAMTFLSCNIDRIADDKKPHKWPPFNLPGDCT